MAVGPIPHFKAFDLGAAAPLQCRAIPSNYNSELTNFQLQVAFRAMGPV